jgi:lysine-N-methylase
MSLFAPIYYKKFKCIADKCKNNCCIGWEIDIDDEALAFYKDKPDIIKQVEISPTPHFKLKNNERCPFLNNDNLCEIITKYGENKLCQICSDHPRFRNFFNSRTEIGLGMCCEAATEIILNNDFSLTEIDCYKETEDLEEKEFFEYRDEIMKRSPDEFVSLLPHYTLNEIYKVLYNMEKLSDKRNEIIKVLKNDNRKISDVILFDKLKFKRIFDYFVFRHLHSENLEFCVLCTYIIASFGEDINENARVFSSEIEYSDENTDILFNILT